MARSPKNKALGRGLDALFADRAPILEEKQESLNEKPVADGKSVNYIDINNIKPNENQPRKHFDEAKIGELAASILEHGIIQPLVVRPCGDYYEIVAGERRWRAARKAELKTVPCVVREFSDEENMLVAIIENLQREDLDPIEEAMGLEQMMKSYGMTQEQVSKSVSKSRPYISNALRLLKLPEEIQELVSEGKLSTGHARAIINVESKSRQMEICRKIIDEGLSVRAVEKIAAEKNKKKKRPTTKTKDPNTAKVETRLKEIYGTKVSIDQKGKKGKITIEYYSREELDRLLDMLISE